MQSLFSLLLLLLLLKLRQLSYGHHLLAHHFFDSSTPIAILFSDSGKTTISSSFKSTLASFSILADFSSAILFESSSNNWPINAAVNSSSDSFLVDDGAGGASSFFKTTGFAITF